MRLLQNSLFHQHNGRTAKKVLKICPLPGLHLVACDGSAMLYRENLLFRNISRHFNQRLKTSTNAVPPKLTSSPKQWSNTKKSTRDMPTLWFTFGCVRWESKALLIYHSTAGKSKPTNYYKF